jgi:casein kinase 1
MQENLPLVGTPAFASINSHRGLQLGRRDDIKSLAYSLIFLHRGLLPWLT